METQTFTVKRKIHAKYFTLIDLSIIDSYMLPPYEDLIEVTIESSVNCLMPIYVRLGEDKPESKASCIRLTPGMRITFDYPLLPKDLWVIYGGYGKSYITLHLTYKA